MIEQLLAKLPDAARWLCMAAMLVTLAVLLVRYFMEPSHPGFRLGVKAEPKDEDELPDVRMTRGIRRSIERREMSWRNQLRPLLMAALWLALSRVLFYGAACFAAWLDGNLSGFAGAFDWHWVRWDADHYIGLAENWYVNEGDARLHIVFFPLYPLLVRVLRPLFLGNTIAAAVTLSNVCLLGCGWLLYWLVWDEQGERAAKRAVRYLMFCPLSVFCSVPYTESLFLLLTLLAVTLARRKLFSLAVVAGALASCTRMLGLLTAIPIFLEMMKHTHSLELWRKGRVRCVSRYVFNFCEASLVAVGFAAYLYLNWRVTGDPLRFLVYQDEHWGQRFGAIWDSLEYSVRYALAYDSEFWRQGVWIPQSVCMALVLALLCAVSRRAHPADGAYAWAYLFCALAPTWLLSGPRYIAAMYALYPMLALVTRRRWQDAALTGAFVAGCLYAGYLYAYVGNLL